MIIEKSEENGKPLWVKRSKEEIESLVTKLAEQGLSCEKIGLILRDTYGVPSTKSIAGKITKILAKTKKVEPADLTHLKQKAEELKLHLEKNKMDKVAKRSLQITNAKIIKLSKYYNKAKAE
jgi:ribosomal protein S15P/S13E